MKNELLFQHYLVVFLDHLGQRSIMREITGLPTNQETREQFLALMKNSLGKVLKLRNTFKEYFNMSLAHKPNTNLVPADLREEFASSQKSEVYYYGFSDSYIIAIPLMNSDDNCTPLNGIYSAFLATCGFGLLSLSIGIIVRGGLDVGIGTKIDNNEIYGPCLERAYFNESQLAEYPRHVVGKELIDYLYWVENSQYSTRFGLYAKELVKLCKGMIIRDNDGHYMLDFLGEKAKEGYGNTINTDIVKNAFVFVKSQHEHYYKKNDHKLASRYHRLMNYFKLRQTVWGIN